MLRFSCTLQFFFHFHFCSLNNKKNSQCNVLDGIELSKFSAVVVTTAVPVLLLFTCYCHTTTNVSYCCLYYFYSTVVIVHRACIFLYQFMNLVFVPNFSFNKQQQQQQTSKSGKKWILFFPQRRKWRRDDE